MLEKGNADLNKPSVFSCRFVYVCLTYCYQKRLKYYYFTLNCYEKRSRNWLSQIETLHKNYLSENIYRQRKESKLISLHVLELVYKSYGVLYLLHCGVIAK